MQHNTENRAQIVKRLISVSRKISPNMSSQELYRSLHEVQQIYLYVLVPYFKGLENLDALLTIENKEADVKVKDFVIAAVQRSSQGKTSGLAFSVPFEAYHYLSADLVKRVDPDQEPLDLSIKRTALLLLQILNLLVTKSALRTLVNDLKSSEDFMEQKFAKELANSSKQQNEMDIAVRASATDTALGASNDGITHLAAIIDLLWEKSDHKKISSLVREATKYLTQVMTSYHSWEIQILDTLVLVEHNPYQITESGELTESQICTEFVEFINRLKGIDQSNLSKKKYVGVLDQTLQVLKFSKVERENTKTVMEAAWSIVESYGFEGPILLENFMALITKKVTVEGKEPLLKCKDPALRKAIEKMDIQVFHKSCSLAQVPAKIVALIDEKVNSDVERSPRCQLLNVPGGFKLWLDALSKSAELFESSSTEEAT